MTIIELLLVIALLTILAALALPDMKQMRDDQQGRLALRKLAFSIALARTEAAESGTMAVLCPSSDGLACGSSWHQGVMVFLDSNDNQSLDANEQLVNYLPFEKLPGTLHWRAFQSKPYLQITPLGFTRYQNGNFTWCNAEGDPASARQLILNRTGRIRFARDRNGDGFRENSSGKPIKCPT